MKVNKHSLIYNLFIGEYNTSAALGYNSYKEELEKYIARVQSKILTLLLMGIFCNMNWLTTGIAKQVFTAISICVIGMFIMTIISIMNDLSYFRSKIRREKFNDFAVDESIVKLCKKMDRLPQTYYSGLMYQEQAISRWCYPNSDRQ